MHHPLLIDLKSGRAIVINKPVFRLGRERKYVDYCFNDAEISRCHCNIICRDGSYLIADTNSTNRTRVDGEYIPANTERELRNGAIVIIADRAFMFLLKNAEAEDE